MKLLLDMCVPLSVARRLSEAGHDVVHVRELDPRAADEWIVSRGREEQRVVVTMDLGFGEIMAHVTGGEPSVILLRLRHPMPDLVMRRIDSAIRRFEEQLEAGAIVLCEDARYRVRLLPIPTGRAT